MPPENPYRVVLVAGSYDKRGFIETCLDPEALRTADVNYLAALAGSIRSAYGTDALHVFSSPVKEELEGKVMWDGIVEVFALVRHPETNRCYAWGSLRADGGWDITTVLALPPIVSPQAAVQVMLRRPVKPN
jgi:hypothetical protein